MDFGTILNHGKRRFKAKEQRGQWGRCDYCEERARVFPYKDNEDEIWMVCDACIDVFVKEEE